MKYDFEQWVNSSNSWTLKKCRELMGLPKLETIKTPCLKCEAPVVTQLQSGIRQHFYCPQCHADMKERDGGLSPVSFGR